jgi:hypothetical protein
MKVPTPSLKLLALFLATLISFLEEEHMKTLPSDEGFNPSRFRCYTVLTFVLLNLAVYLVRLISLWSYGSLFCTSGGESLTIYSVWKSVHHLTVYEWPLRYPFSISLYNYLFYYTYAEFLRLAGIWDAGIMTWGRLLTSGFAIAGAIAQWRLVSEYLKLRGARSLLSLLFALGLWLSTSMVRWWALTIRPDMAAVALVMIAICVVVSRPRFGIAFASALFFLAWSFKQSVVLAFAGVCLYLLLHKRWRDLSVLVSVFSLLVTATLILGTPEYRYCILVAPRLVSEFSLLNAWHAAEVCFVANAYWMLAPMALLLATGKRRIVGVFRLLMTVFAVALVAGLAAMGKVGAADNYLLEAFVAGSTLLQVAVFLAPGRLIGFLVLFGCVQPAVQLATVPSGSRIFGTVRLATAAEYANAVALRARLDSMAKPIFTTDETFALPWLSTANRAPAFVIDTKYHDATKLRCQNGCIDGMLQKGDIPTVMIGPGDSLYQHSLNSSYKKVGAAYHQGKQYSIYAIHNSAPGISLPTR